MGHPQTLEDRRVQRLIRRAPPLALFASLLLLGSGVWLVCARRPLAVEYARCWRVLLPGPACVLGRDRELRLWAPVALGDEVEILAGRQRLQVAGRLVAGGRNWVLTIPPEAKSLEVRARSETGSRAWTLRFLPDVHEQGLEIYDQASEKLREEDHAEAQTLLEQARQIHRKSGWILNEARDVGTLVHSLIQVRHFEKARAVLRGFAPPPGAPAEAAYLRSYSLGLLSANVGDARGALAALEEAASVANRLGMVAERFDAEEVRAVQLQALGRTGDARKAFERLESESSPEIRPCEWATMRVNQAWTLILAREAGDAGLGDTDPIPILEEAREIALHEGCPRSEEKRRTFHLNRALAHFQARRWKEAREDLKRLEGLTAGLRPLDLLWSLDLAARLDLAERNSQRAKERYENLDELAQRWALPEGRWRAAFGRAACLEDLGATEDALREYDRAEGLVDQETLQIPIQEGRDTFVAQRRAATDRHIELLLRLGREDEALGVARLDRSRVLRELERADRLAHLSPREQERWDALLATYQAQRSALDEGVSDERRLPSEERRQKEDERRSKLAAAERELDEAWRLLVRIGSSPDLPSLLPGEVVLAYRPVGGKWLGFAADSLGVKVERFDLPPLAPHPPGRSEDERVRFLAKRLLGPFAAQIGRAKRVRVLSQGDLRAVDFHALPFGDEGRVLLEHAPVVYGLDVFRAQGSGAFRPASPLALVVGDPGNNLPSARREAEEVAGALRDRWEVEPLLRSEATREAVQAALARVELFHYAGHGEVAGFGGWESELPLAGGSRLTLGDLLALERAPAWVVLSGCETGRSGTEAPVEGVSLAHAFLLAGSRGVIASTRKVDDAEARRFFALLYEEGWPWDPDLAAILQRAQIKARNRHIADSAWASFRVFEP